MVVLLHGVGDRHHEKNIKYYAQSRPPLGDAISLITGNLWLRRCIHSAE